MQVTATPQRNLWYLCLPSPLALPRIDGVCAGVPSWSLSETGSVLTNPQIACNAIVEMEITPALRCKAVGCKALPGSCLKGRRRLMERCLSLYRLLRQGGESAGQLTSWR